MMKNDTLAAALDELRQHGIPSEIVGGSKHIQVRWVNRLGEPRFATVSRRDAGEWHSPQNARRQVRQTLRADGMLPEVVKPEPLPPSRLPNRYEQLERDMRLLNERISHVEKILKERTA